MNHHLTQIAVLLMTYVAINNASSVTMCPPVNIRPVLFPPEYLIGTWRAAYCSVSPLCSRFTNCNEYYYNTTGDGNMMLHIRGYNTLTQKLEESEGEVQLTFRPGEYVVENIGDIKRAHFYMLYPEQHFCVLFACFTDQNDETTQAAFISTKNNPFNQISEHQLDMAMSILEPLGISDSLITPPYFNCHNFNQSE